MELLKFNQRVSLVHIPYRGISHLDPGKTIPWHCHSSITDLVFAVSGLLTVRTRDPDAHRILQPGDSQHFRAGQPHTLSNETQRRIEFLLIQGVGEYDFRALDAGADLSSVSLQVCGQPPPSRAAARTPDSPRA